jgi:hypothetical protein
VAQSHKEIQLNPKPKLRQQRRSSNGR